MKSTAFVMKILVVNCNGTSEGYKAELSYGVLVTLEHDPVTHSNYKCNKQLYIHEIQIHHQSSNNHVCMFMYVRMYVYMYVCMYIFMHVYVCMYVCMYVHVCMCICMCVYFKAHAGTYIYYYKNSSL